MIKAYITTHPEMFILVAPPKINDGNGCTNKGGCCDMLITRGSKKTPFLQFIIE